MRATDGYRTAMQRPSSRLLVVDHDRRILLFRFEHKRGPLSGQVFWATPGGGLDEGETYEDAAKRELLEEVGLGVDDIGPQIARRFVTFAIASGEMVEADERYFLVRTERHIVTDASWTALEREVVTAHQWWSQAELINLGEPFWPEDLADILVQADVWS